MAFDALAKGASDASKAARRSLWVFWTPAVLAVAAAVLTGRLFGGDAAKWAVLSPYAAYGASVIVLGPVIMIAAAALCTAAGRGMRLALGGLLVFAAVDQAIYGISYITQTPPEALEIIEASVRLPEAPGFFRIDAVPSMDDVATLDGFNLVTGYVGLNPAKTLDYSESAALRLSSTAYRLIMKDAPEGEDAPGELEIDVVERPLPRARTVTKAVKSDDAAKVIGEIDIDTTAIVDQEVQLDDGEPGGAVVVKSSPGRMTILTDTPGRQLLVVNESFHRGWKARVDGQETSVVRCYGDFMGVVVDKGSHEVEMEFAPESLRLGGFVSLASAALLTLAMIVTSAAVRRGKKRAAKNTG